jgi:hypothetical protein
MTYCRECGTEMLWLNLGYHPEIWNETEENHKKKKKSSVRIFSVLVEIQTGHLLTVSFSEFPCDKILIQLKLHSLIGLVTSPSLDKLITSDTFLLTLP